MVTEFSPFFGINRDLAKLFDLAAPQRTFNRQFTSYPPLNISEDENAIFVSAEVPGVAMGDLEITLVDETLTIQGERKAGEGRMFRQERPTGVFQRVIRLGHNVDRDAIKATLREGILEVVLPKSDAAKPRKISIES